MGRLKSRVSPVFFERHPNLISRLDDGVLWEAPFKLLPLSTSANASELRGRLAAMGLTLTRASAATVQTSASTVVTSGIGVDDPRVGDAGYGRGLVLEESRQNKLVRSDTSVTSLAWGATVAGGNTLSGETVAADGPDGGNAVKLTSSAVTGSFAHWYMGAGVATAAPYTFSSWLRGEVGGEVTSISSTPNGVTYFRNACTLTTGWQRFSATGTGTAATWYAQIGTDKRDASQPNTPAQITRAALAQYELGAFPTELVVTTGAAATRAADALTLNRSLVRGGRFGVEYVFVPKASKGDISATSVLYYEGTNCYTAIHAVNGNVQLIVGGALVYNSAASGGYMNWSRGDVIKLWIEGGGGALQSRAKYSRNGVVTDLGAGDGSVAPAIVPGATANLARDWSFWLQSVRAYAPGRRPQWAA